LRLLARTQFGEQFPRVVHALLDAVPRSARQRRPAVKVPHGLVGLEGKLRMAAGSTGVGGGQGNPRTGDGEFEFSIDELTLDFVAEFLPVGQPWHFVIMRSIASTML
jgi:hypothetical protein